MSIARLYSFIHSLCVASPSQRDASALYIALTASSRKPFFFTECKVPDTLDGRFEVLVLHLFMVLQALEGKSATQRALLEVFFADMDRSLREMGVGDMGISRRIKAMSKAAFGRIEAYKAAHTESEWHAALARNVYRGADVPANAIAALHQAMLFYSSEIRNNIHPQPSEGALS